MGTILTELWPARKFLAATFTTEQYQQNISASLAEVDTQSGNLIDQARLSSDYEISYTMRAILNSRSIIPTGSLLQFTVYVDLTLFPGTSQWKHDIQRLHHGQQQIRGGQARLEHGLRNGFMVLLDECNRNRQSQRSHLRPNMGAFAHN